MYVHTAIHSRPCMLASVHMALFDCLLFHDLRAGLIWAPCSAVPLVVANVRANGGAPFLPFPHTHTLLLYWTHLPSFFAFAFDKVAYDLISTSPLCLAICKEYTFFVLQRNDGVHASISPCLLYLDNLFASKGFYRKYLSVLATQMPNKCRVHTSTKCYCTDMEKKERRERKGPSRINGIFTIILHN